MNILLNKKTYAIQNKNISFSASSLELFRNDAGRLASDYQKPEERQHDVELGTKIQNLRRKIIEEKRAAANEKNPLQKDVFLKNVDELNDKKAALVNELVERHLRLSFLHSRKHRSYRPDEASAQEIISAANLGLMRAAEKFNPVEYPDSSFANYAKFWINASVRRALAKDVQVFVPVSTKRNYDRVQVMKDDFQKEFGKEPSYDELSKKIGYKRDKALRELLSVAKVSQVSLNTPVGDDGRYCLSDLIPDDTPAFAHLDDKSYAEEKIARLRHFIDTILSPNERKVILDRFGLNGSKHPGISSTLREISIDMGRTSERIRQIEGDALKKLKKAMSVPCE